MRWIFLLVALLGFSLAFLARTPETLGLGLVLGLIGLFGALFGFAAARVASSARPDAALLTDKDINALRVSMRKPGTTPSANAPSVSSVNMPSANGG